MAFNIFETHTMLQLMKEVVPTHSFLLDRYFKTNAATDIFSTADVLVEYQDGNHKASPFVSPRKNGVAVTRQGYELSKLEPAHIAVARTLTVDDLSKIGFGEALYSTLTPEQRQGAMLMHDLEDLRKMNVRRKEAMAAEVIFTNGCVMHEYVDDFGKYSEKQVQYYTGTNDAVFTPSANWDTTEESGKQIYDDIHAMIQMLTEKGLPATEMLVGSNVASILVKNEFIQKVLDNRRYELGRVDPKSLPAGAAVLMTLNVYGHMIDVLTYDGSYQDVDGTTKYYVPANMVAVGAPDAGHTIYGAITQVEQADGEFHTYAAVDVPKYLSDPVANVRSITLSSAPLCVPKAKNCFIAATVTE